MDIPVALKSQEVVPSQDRLLRPLKELRMSVIDRCNFRCSYCMPLGSMKGKGSFLPLEKLLTDHEIVNLARAFVGLGVHKLRLTGGEPLIRPGFPALIAQLSEIPGLDDIALTTNGVMLTRLAKDLAEAGLTRITVSLDTLDQDTLDTLSGGKAKLHEVLAGIAAAEAAGFEQIKINTVVQKGVNDHTIMDLLDHFRGTRHPVRLIEYMDGKVFRASIFPIPPGGTQKLEIKFGQVLQKQGGLYRYHYPRSAGKDYATAKTEKDFTLVARVHAPIPVTTVYSPTHKISSHRKSDNEVLVGTEELYATLDKDFDLYVGHSKQDIGLNIMTHDPDGEGGENGYFMLALAPRVEVASHDEIGQTFTFVMDTSGSMAGDKIEQARKTLEFCLSRLRPQDRFNVVRFSTDVEALAVFVDSARQHNFEALDLAIDSTGVEVEGSIS